MRPVDNNETLAEGTEVLFDTGTFQGQGAICGVYSKLPLCTVYIVVAFTEIPKDYPYSCFCVPHGHLKVLEPGD